MHLAVSWERGGEGHVLLLARDRRMQDHHLYGKVDIKLHGKGYTNPHGARPVYQNHLDDKVDSDQQVVNKELSLSPSLAKLWNWER